MKDVRVQVGERVMIVDSNTAKMIRRKIQQRREKDRRVARELKELGMLPNEPENALADWISEESKLMQDKLHAHFADIGFAPDYAALTAEVSDPRD